MSVSCPVLEALDRLAGDGIDLEPGHFTPIGLRATAAAIRNKGALPWWLEHTAVGPAVARGPDAIAAALEQLAQIGDEGGWDW